MNSVNIEDIDLNNSFFHFTTRDRLEQINQEGLKAQIGGASQMKTEEKPRVYMSKGGKGILGIKNSFIHEFKKLRVCDIPLDYRKYFEIKDFSSEEIVQENDVYHAMEKRFKNEIYFKVDAVEGEDFIAEDFLPEELKNEVKTSNNLRDIKGKENHDIAPDKLFIITTDKGNSALDVLEYLYNRLMENAKKDGKEDSVKWALSDLDGLFRYIKKEQILAKQREIYQGDLEKEENNGNIKNIDITKLTDEELQKSCFHYSLKKDKNSIDKNGLETKIGRNSKDVDKLQSIYFSYGLEGVLETWDVWLKWRANRLYSPYWQEENKDIAEKIENDTATEQEKREYYYKAKLWNEEFTLGKYKEDKEKMDFLFDFQIDEMHASNYYLLDLKEGENFSFDEIDIKKEANLKRKDKPNDIGYKIFQEMYEQYSNFESTKVDKWNMNTFLGKKLTIKPDRIKQLTLPNGKNNVLYIVEYLYDKYKEITPKGEQVQFDLLDKYMEYVKEKIKNHSIPEFDRNTRIDEHELISHFYDQKSDSYFEDISNGIYSIPEYTITPNKVGKRTFYTDIEQKEIARSIVDKKIEERTHLQELEHHDHNGSHGGTNYEQ